MKCKKCAPRFRGDDAPKSDSLRRRVETPKLVLSNKSYGLRPALVKQIVRAPRALRLGQIIILALRPALFKRKCAAPLTLVKRKPWAPPQLGQTESDLGLRPSWPNRKSGAPPHLGKRNLWGDLVEREIWGYASNRANRKLGAPPHLGQTKNWGLAPT